MPTKYTVTVSYMGTSSVIAIPKPVCDGFGIRKGDKLELIVRDNGIYIPIVENSIVGPVEHEIQKAVRRRQAQAEDTRATQTREKAVNTQ